MALGQYGKRRLGTFGGKKPSAHSVSGPSTAVGGPKPDSTAKWPKIPGKRGPKKPHGQMIKTRVAGDY